MTTRNELVVAVAGRYAWGAHGSPTPACEAAIGNTVRLFPLPGGKS